MSYLYIFLYTVFLYKCVVYSHLLQYIPLDSCTPPFGVTKTLYTVFFNTVISLHVVRCMTVSVTKFKYGFDSIVVDALIGNLLIGNLGFFSL